MINQTNSNPDFYRYTVEETDAQGRHSKRRIVYCTTARPLVLATELGGSEEVEHVSGGEHLTVFALHVVLLGALRFPSRDVRIVCQTLTVPAAARDAAGHERAGAVDVSAEALDVLYRRPWPTPEATGPAGAQPGLSGDEVAARLNKGEGKALGSEGPHAFGRPGDAAGSITLVCDELVLEGPLQLQADGGDGRSGCNGQGSPRSRGGDGGRAGNGGAAGRINVQAGTIRNRERLGVSARPGQGGTPGKPGAGTRADTGGRPAAVASPGSAGSLLVRSEAPPHVVGDACDAIFLRKLLQRARLIYLFNEPRSFSGSVELPPRWEELGQLLDWGAGITQHLLARRGGETQRSGKTLLANGLATLKQRRDALKTYFGWRADWVPSLPLDRMFELFDKGYPVRARLEDSYLRVTAAMDDAAKGQAALTQAREAVGQALALHKARAEMLLTELTDKLPAQVTAARVRCEQARSALEDRLARFKRAVQDHFQCPSMDDLLKGAEMIVFTADKLPLAATMGGVQLAEMFNTGRGKIRNNLGKDVDKAEVVDEIVVLGEDLKQSATDAVVETGPDGRPAFTQSTKALLTSLEKFRQEVLGLTNELDSRHGGDGQKPSQALARALADFESALTEKGDALLTSTFYMIRLVEEVEACDEARDRQAELEGRIDPLSPAWASAAAYLAAVYQNSLERCAESVAMMERKAAYLTLETPAKIDMVQSLCALWDGGPPPSQQGIDELAARVHALRESVAQASAEMRAPKLTIPSDPQALSDLCVSVTDKDLLAQLWDPDRRSLKLYVVRELTGRPGELTVGNDRMYDDIRVHKVQPVLLGAQTASGRLTLGVRAPTQASMHLGDASAFHFSMQYARETNLTHRTGTAPETLFDHAGHSGGDGQLVDDFLDAPGLYGTWTVTLPEATREGDNNRGLDTSAVTELRIYFTVAARPRAMRRLRAIPAAQEQ